MNRRPTAAFSSFIRLCLLWQRYRFEWYRRVDVIPGKIFLFTAPEFIHILLEFIPSRFPVDADFFEERPVIGAVPVELADLVRMRAHRQSGELGFAHDGDINLVLVSRGGKLRLVKRRHAAGV